MNYDGMSRAQIEAKLEGVEIEDIQDIELLRLAYYALDEEYTTFLQDKSSYGADLRKEIAYLKEIVDLRRKLEECEPRKEKPSAYEILRRLKEKHGNKDAA